MIEWFKKRFFYKQKVVVLVAMGVVAKAFFTFLLCFVGILGFLQLKEDFRAISKQDYPFIITLSKILVEVEALTSEAYALNLSSSQFERRSVIRRLSDREARLETLKQEMDSFGAAKDVSEAVFQTSTSIIDNIRSIDEMMEKKISAEENIMKFERKFISLRRTAVKSMAPILQKDWGKNPKRTFLIASFFKHIESLSLTYQGLRKVTLETQVDDSEAEFQSALEGLKTDIDRMDAETRKPAEEFLTSLKELASDTEVISMYRQKIALSFTLSGALRINRQALAIFDSKVFAKFQELNKQLDQHQIRYDSYLNFGYMFLFFVLGFTIVLGYLTFLLLNKKLLKRLEGLRLSVMDSVEGESSHIEVMGEDEIADLAKGIKYFIGAKGEAEQKLAIQVKELSEQTEYLEKQRREMSKLVRSLAEAKDKAEVANRAKSEFLANMSHELRTPLNAIIGFSETMTQEIFGSLPDKYKEYTGIIFSSGQHLLKLINEILDLAKVEAGRVELEEEEFVLNALLDEIHNIAKGYPGSERLNLTTAVEGTLRLKADRRMVSQIVLNIVSNSIKFTPDGGAVMISAGKTEDNSTFIRIKDTGIGVEKSKIPYILQPFSQVESAFKRKHAGTGLGLSLSIKLLELHNGTFTFDSDLGKGTEVILLFPPDRTL